MKFHREPREAPVYALVAMMEGHKLRAPPFAISLEWAAREPLTGGDDKPSLFTAVQEQLGLRLEPATDAVDAFIIDSVEPPTPN